MYNSNVPLKEGVHPRNCECEGMSWSCLPEYSGGEGENLQCNLKVHGVYKSSECINERARIISIRLRLSVQNLSIEKGRWSRIDRDYVIVVEYLMYHTCCIRIRIRLKYNANIDLHPDRYRTFNGYF